MIIFKVYPDGNKARSMTIDTAEEAQAGLDTLASNYDEVIERGDYYVIVSGGIRFEIE